MTDADGQSDTATVSLSVLAATTDFDFDGAQEEQVNTHTRSDQKEPAVSALVDGGYVVVWESQGQDGSDDGIYGQRYDDDGDAVGDEFRVNSQTSRDQEDPAVAGLEDGGYVVVWEAERQDGSDNGVRSCALLRALS